MGDATHKGHPCDPFHPAPGDQDKDRGLLDAIFKAGEKARRDGAPLRDNPYAAGSEERQEWAAGWCATVKPDDTDEEPNSGYAKN